MRPLSEATSRVAKSNFSRKYIALGKIVNRWDEIVGPELAGKAQPVKIQYRRKKTRKDKPSATLEVACASADATILHYQKGVILERMNTIFGDRWIADLKFVPIERAPSKSFRRRRIKRKLDELDHGFLKETLGQIEDADIKQRLESLGQNILMDKVE